MRMMTLSLRLSLALRRLRERWIRVDARPPPALSSVTRQYPPCQSLQDPAE
jgi:hypothetical protein